MLLTPNELYQQLRLHCEENGIGMFRCIDPDNDLEVLVLARDDGEMKASTAALIAAEILIRGVLTGGIDRATVMNREKVSDPTLN